MALMLLTTSSYAGDAEAREMRYSYSATRGAWPASETAEEKATPRYVQTPPALTDLQTLEAMKATIADSNNSKKYIAVLFTGWDWCERGSQLLVEWRKGLGDKFVTTVYDWPETDYVITEGENQGVNVSSRSRENAYAGTLHHAQSRGR